MPQPWDVSPTPRERAALFQKVLNESWPRQPRSVPEHPPVKVWVRIEWERDGEQWVAGQTDRWNRHFVQVRVDDRRLQVGVVWVGPSDVRRQTKAQAAAVDNPPADAG